ncbi:cytochrome p450 [Trichoderma arundinaceum]|uniref:Cytochrome p450 n=1 Tax=Trichoderma arundinaceum TaxID=490622 RepID=A0A395NVU2_TRIAR|nr:cytochrome p450 [Trichoderma arundinaceum]
MIERIGSVSLWEGALYAALLYGVYIVGMSMYRLTLHPLASFPGPKLAAVSYLYEIWYDMILGGRYTSQIGKLHKIYGPVVRINPDELHCNDPKFLDTLYPSGVKNREKVMHWINAFPSNLHEAMTFTRDHQLHRKRRATLIKFFSRSRILKLQDTIQVRVHKLCDKLLASRGQGELGAVKVYSTFATDIISDYLYGWSFNFLDKAGWDANYLASMEMLESMAFINRHIPFVRDLQPHIPPWAVRPFSSDMSKAMQDMMVNIPNEIDRIKGLDNKDLEKQRETVFSSMLQSDLPASEKSTERLAADAAVLLNAGTDTTARALSVLTFYLLDQPMICDKVRTELKTVVEDPTQLPPWEALEKLPYLSSVILEGIRLSHGVTGRMPRIAPDEDMVYKGVWNSSDVTYVIPRGWAIGTSSPLIHTHESIFPQPLEFIPERWLDEKKQRRRDLESYIMSFGKGSRICLGMQLAHCQLYIAVSALVLRVMPHMELYKTTKEDAEYDHDGILARPRPGSKGGATYSDSPFGGLAFTVNQVT